MSPFDYQAWSSRCDELWHYEQVLCKGQKYCQGHIHNLGQSLDDILYYKSDFSHCFYRWSQLIYLWANSNFWPQRIYYFRESYRPLSRRPLSHRPLSRGFHECISRVRLSHGCQSRVRHSHGFLQQEVYTCQISPPQPLAKECGKVLQHHRTWVRPTFLQESCS